MIPKYRAWISEGDTMTYDIKGIDFENETVVLRITSWDEEHSVEEEIFEVEVGNAILMQSLGLFDKFGVEIFESDILTDGRELACIKKHPTLGFYADRHGYVEYIARSLSLKDFEGAVKTVARNLEVVGNIYETPQLLKVDNELD